MTLLMLACGFFAGLWISPFVSEWLTNEIRREG